MHKKTQSKNQEFYRLDKKISEKYLTIMTIKNEKNLSQSK